MKKTGLHKNPAGGKGVYLAIAVSAVAVGAVAWLATSGLNNQIDPIAPPEQVASLPNSQPTEQAAVSKEDVPKTENFVVSYPVSDAENSVTAEIPDEEDTLPANEPVETPVESSAPAEETPVTMNWASPVDGTSVTNGFSNGELVKSKTLGEWRTHDGIDLAAAEGASVKACADGVVKDVRLDSRWGYVAEVEHGDVTTYYCGLKESVKVKPGQELKQGDQIGEVGNTSVVEASEEPHLHLGMKKEGKWINPAETLGL